MTAIGPGEAKHQYVCEAGFIAGDLVLDFGADGRLLGIEFLSADRQLPLDLIEKLRSANAAKPKQVREEDS